MKHPSFLRKKLGKFGDIRAAEGLRAALSHAVNFLVAKTGWYGDHRVLGRLLELTGNVSRLDGCRFPLTSPLISTALKSRYLLNRYERPERDAVRRFLDPAVPVVELGAATGVVACVTGKRLTHPENHVVVEANPELIPLLRANRDLNGCSFTIVNKALGYGSGEIAFYTNHNDKFMSGSVRRVTDTKLSVPTVTLAELLALRGFERATLICDIEGAELDLVEHERDLLSKRIVQLIIEMHPSFIGEEGVARVESELRLAGFRRVRTGRYCSTLVFQNDALSSLSPRR